MNKNKISFIVLVTDERQYQECVLYLQDLFVPQQLQLEIIAIRDFPSPAAGYNRGMNSSDAKYKIYLKDTIRIIYKNCLKEMVCVFQQNQDCGLLGLIGAKNCPTNANWWEAKHKYGQVWIEKATKIQLLELEAVKESYEVTEIVADALIMTQYDIPWREDIFTGLYFYDCAQSIEFKNKNYKVGIIRTTQAWAMVQEQLYETVIGSKYCSDSYDQAKDCFLDEYSDSLFPLVSIWIPTHNRPDYLKVALGCVMAQSYRNVEVCISDNSNDEETANFIRPYLVNKRIKYFRFYPDRTDADRDKFIENYKNKNLDPYSGFIDDKMPMLANWITAWRMAKGEYLSLLCDDDWMHPDKVMRVLQCYLDYPDVSLVTSYRYLIDDDGTLRSRIAATTKICEENTLYMGSDLGKEMLMSGVNFIGENIIYHSRYAKGTMLYGYYNKRYYATNTDIAAWLELLRQGNAIYLVDGLTGFRLSGSNDQCKLDVQLTGNLDWYHFHRDSYRDGLFLDDKAYFLKFLIFWQQTMSDNPKWELLRGTVAMTLLEESLIEAKRLYHEECDCLTGE